MYYLYLYTYSYLTYTRVIQYFIQVSILYQHTDLFYCVPIIKYKITHLYFYFTFTKYLKFYGPYALVNKSIKHILAMASGVSVFH